MNKILVAYASSAGSTGGVAETIGHTLSNVDVMVDVHPIQSVTSLEDYCAVVIGSAIHGGKYLPEAVNFVQTNQVKLCQIPTAFFLVCMMMTKETEKNKNMVVQFLDAERALVKPVAEGYFSGALFPNTYPFFMGLGLRIFLTYLGLGMKGGDYRNMDAIRTWALNIQPLLTP